jgi:hypothetical protein
MHIETMEVSNFLGVSHVAITPKAKVVLVAGANGAGKTSVYQAIRLAWLDELPRIELKRDAAALLRGGAAKGSVMVKSDRGTTAITLPSRTRAGSAMLGTNTTIALAPSEFTGWAPEDRKRFVLAMSGTALNRDAIAKRLEARGIPAELIAEIRPLLAAGFDSAMGSARDRAAQARGAWRAVTGEVYGSKKAEGWRPDDVPALPEPPVGMDEAIANHDAAVRAHSALVERAAAAAKAVEQRKVDRTLVATKPEVLAAIEANRENAGAEEERETLACPDCGCALLLVNGKLEKYTPPATGKRVKASVRAAAKRAFEAAIINQNAIAQAEARLAGPMPEPPAEGEVAAALEAKAERADVLRTLQGQHEKYAEAKRAADTQSDRMASARKHHENVGAWEKAEEALSPNGIPSELIGEALAPLRAAIGAVTTDAIRDWPLPVIGDDCNVTAWGRPYGLLSESEQWRVDAVLGAAVANVTGMRFLALDRADILEPAQRGPLMDWLLATTDAGTLDQAWIFATLKGDPKMLAEDGVESHWIVNGSEA